MSTTCTHGEMYGSRIRCPYCIEDEAKDNRLSELEAQLAAANARLERATDLVRFQRHKLYDAGLIDDLEWAAMVADSNSGQRVARLESYDGIRKQLAAANERIAELERIIASMKLADDAKAQSLSDEHAMVQTAIGQRDEARKEVERLSTPVTDEEMDLFALHVIHVVQPDRTLPVLTIDRATALLATRARKGSPK